MFSRTRTFTVSLQNLQFDPSSMSGICRGLKDKSFILGLQKTYQQEEKALPLARIWAPCLPLVGIYSKTIWGESETSTPACNTFGIETHKFFQRSQSKVSPVRKGYTLIHFIINNDSDHFLQTETNGNIHFLQLQRLRTTFRYPPCISYLWKSLLFSYHSLLYNHPYIQTCLTIDQCTFLTDDHMSMYIFFYFLKLRN